MIIKIFIFFKAPICFQEVSGKVAEKLCDNFEFGVVGSFFKYDWIVCLLSIFENVEPVVFSDCVSLQL